jgi:hypothetical protein
VIDRGGNEVQKKQTLINIADKRLKESETALNELDAS